MIVILTKWQQNRFDEFEEAIHRKEMLFRNAKVRGIGKTYLLNELGLTLQVLGYEVLVYTSYDRMEYFAEKFIYNDYDLQGINILKAIILFDEAKLDNDEVQEILKYSRCCQIPVVGFVRYKDDDLMKFKTEYKCEWVKD
jgi:hypothetical protein